MELQTGPSRSESLSCVIELWYFMAELRIYILNGENIAKPAPPVPSFALFLSHKVLAQHKNLRVCFPFGTRSTIQSIATVVFINSNNDFFVV